VRQHEGNAKSGLKTRINTHLGSSTLVAGVTRSAGATLNVLSHKPQNMTMGIVPYLLLRCRANTNANG
jgi:hypothetical protein